MIKFTPSDIKDKWAALYSERYIPELEFDDSDDEWRDMLSHWISEGVFHENAVARLNALGIT